METTGRIRQSSSAFSSAGGGRSSPAEAGGGLGFLLRPPALCDAPSRAAVRLRVSARPGPGPPEPPGRRLGVELLHCRGGAAGATAELELDHETGDVRLVEPAPALFVAYA